MKSLFLSVIFIFFIMLGCPATIPTTDNKIFWHHREMIRYKYGKTKKLTDALEFLEAKYKELHSLVEPLEKDIK